MGKIFYIIGKSGSGKDTVYKYTSEVFKEDLIPIVLYTTRPMRPGEVDGETYHFISKEEMDKLNIIEMRKYNTIHGDWYYATIDDGSIDLNKYNYIAMGTPASLTKIQEHFGKDNIVAICLLVDDYIRMRRLVHREHNTNDDYTEMCRRWLTDEKDFSDVNTHDINMSFIDNDKDISTTIDKIVELFVPLIIDED